jgi:hypothetical protein
MVTLTATGNMARAGYWIYRFKDVIQRESNETRPVDSRFGGQSAHPKSQNERTDSQ